MKYMKWKILIITSLVCLAPILFGIAVWDMLPESVPIHFDINNNPDNYSSKGFAVFGLPILMALVQIFCCISCDINACKNGEQNKFVTVTKWLIPVITIVLYIVTLAYALGYLFNIKAVAMIIVGLVFVVMGNYMPKFDKVKNFNVDAEKARKINRFIGKLSVILGFLFLISALLPPIVSLVCLFLMIPYVVVTIVYSIKVAKE